MHTSVTWQSTDIFIVGFSRTAEFSGADNLKSEAKFG